MKREKETVGNAIFRIQTDINIGKKRELNEQESAIISQITGWLIGNKNSLWETTEVGEKNHYADGEKIATSKDTGFNEVMRHELGHYIAFQHEHQKWNRNDYLDPRPGYSQDPIIPQCPTPCYATNVMMGINLIDGFDYESIMNYNAIFHDRPFYIKNTTNIFTVPGYVSEKDKQAVNILYP